MRGPASSLSSASDARSSLRCSRSPAELRVLESRRPRTRHPSWRKSSAVFVATTGARRVVEVSQRLGGSEADPSHASLTRTGRASVAVNLPTSTRAIAGTSYVEIAARIAVVVEASDDPCTPSRPATRTTRATSSRRSITRPLRAGVVATRSAIHRQPALTGPSAHGQASRAT